MSQELIGGCGAIVGSGEYFQRINQNALFTPFLPSSSGYQYSTAIERICAQCASVIDEIYSDMRNNKSALSKISDSQKGNLLALIGNLEEAAGFFLPAFTNASGCRDILEHCDSGDEEEVLSIWSDDIGSDSYLQSKCSPIFKSIFSDPLTNISQRIRQDLYNIAGEMTADIDLGLHMHHYVRDENGEALRGAVNELGRCGCGSVSFYASKIQTLCWYREISSNNVLALQKALNKVPGSDTLTEDGVYGEKTSSSYNLLMNELLHGSFPMLTFIDPLQSEYTGIRAVTKTTKAGDHFSQIFADGTPWPIFRADKHPIKSGKTLIPHFNVETVKAVKPEEVPKWQKSMVAALDHKEVPEWTYNLLKNFDDTVKIIKIGGKILLVSGAIADAVVLGDAIHTDLTDADQKLGKLTAQTSASIVGSWGGSALGAEAGAYIGAEIGTMVLPGLGTLVGGAVGGIALGIVGSIGGSALGEWVVDISNIWE